jgi:hypothetical protein
MPGDRTDLRFLEESHHKGTKGTKKTRSLGVFFVPFVPLSEICSAWYSAILRWFAMTHEVQLVLAFE